MHLVLIKYNCLIAGLQKKKQKEKRKQQETKINLSGQTPKKIKSSSSGVLWQPYQRIQQQPTNTLFTRPQTNDIIVMFDTRPVTACLYS